MDTLKQYFLLDLQWTPLYKTLLGLIMVEVAFTMPFATLIFRTFMANIPRELDEAAIIDGASPVQVFFFIILPLLRPAIITVIVTSSVGIYNDFVSPLYFLPGSANVTAQLTLFSFMSQFSSQWNLLLRMWSLSQFHHSSCSCSSSVSSFQD